MEIPPTTIIQVNSRLKRPNNLIYNCFIRETKNIRGYLERLKGVFKKMKREYFLVILFLILAIFLSGCGVSGIVTPATDEAKIKSIIQNYAFALNDQNWNEAKSYCVYNSIAYQMVEVYEFYIANYNVEAFVYKIDKIKDIEIDDNYVQAYIHIVSTLGSWYENIYLQKVSDIWKIYNNSYAIYG